MTGHALDQLEKLLQPETFEALERDAKDARMISLQYAVQNPTAYLIFAGFEVMFRTIGERLK